MKKNHIIRQMHSHIARAKDIALLTHENPDIDAISSVMAFSHYLDNLNKQHTIFLKNVPPGMFDELLFQKSYSTDPEAMHAKPYEVIIVFDSGDLHHTGIETIIVEHQKKATICNIDHHPTNNFFGSINLVEINAVSTTEIIYDFIKEMRNELSAPQAEYLLAGILGDTNNFTNHNTTPRSVEIAAKLIRRGVNVGKIAETIKQKKSLETIHCWGKIFSRLVINKKYNIAIAVISKKDMEKLEEHPEMFNGVANYLNNISGVKCSMVIKEFPDEVIKVSMRSNDNLLDLSKFTKLFNGGGHKKAAGFSIRGKLVETDTGGWKIE